jgi:hypothetical protein
MSIVIKPRVESALDEDKWEGTARIHFTMVFEMVAAYLILLEEFQKIIFSNISAYDYPPVSKMA